MPFSRVILMLVTLSLVCRAPPPALADTPKYAAHAVPLALSHDYFRRAPAPDYWALSPYYIAQRNDSSCSTATAAMLLNAALSPVSKSDSDTLITQEGLMARLGDKKWTEATRRDGAGVTLAEFAVLLANAFRSYGFADVRVEAIPVTSTGSRMLEKLKDVLRQNEMSADEFMVLNFLQGVYTGSAMVGHFAPLAAYDAKTRRALVMDPDREWYEPYWVPLEKLIAGMATTDETIGKSRGYLLVRPGKRR